MSFQPPARFGISFYLDDVEHCGGPIELWPLTHTVFDEDVFGQKRAGTYERMDRGKQPMKGASKWRWDTFRKNDGNTHDSELDAMNRALCSRLPSEKVAGKAGTVIMRTYHIWHRGTRNESNKDRLLYTLSLSPRDKRKWLQEHLLFQGTTEVSEPPKLKLWHVLLFSLRHRTPSTFIKAVILRLLGCFIHDEKGTWRAMGRSQVLNWFVGSVLREGYTMVEENLMQKQIL